MLVSRAVVRLSSTVPARADRGGTEWRRECGEARAASAAAALAQPRETMRRLMGSGMSAGGA